MPMLEILPGDTLNITLAQRIAGSLKSIKTTASYRVDTVFRERSKLVGWPYNYRLHCSRVMHLVTLPPTPGPQFVLEHVPVLIARDMAFMGTEEWPVHSYELIMNLESRLRMSLAAKGIVVPHQCPECSAELDLHQTHICPARS